MSGIAPATDEETFVSDGRAFLTPAKSKAGQVRVSAKKVTPPRLRYKDSLMNQRIELSSEKGL